MTSICFRSEWVKSKFSDLVKFRSVGWALTHLGRSCWKIRLTVCNIFYLNLKKKCGTVCAWKDSEISTVHYMSQWSHGAETFSPLLSLGEGEPPITGRFHLQRTSDAEVCVFVFSHRNERFCSSVPRADVKVVLLYHYDDVIMTMLASQITSLMVVYSIVYSGVNQRKHQSSASLAFVREIHRGPVNFPHKWPVTRKMFPFDDVIMITLKGGIFMVTIIGLPKFE